MKDNVYGSTYYFDVLIHIIRDILRKTKIYDSNVKSFSIILDDDTNISSLV